jgi:hypothetical protein
LSQTRHGEGRRDRERRRVRGQGLHGHAAGAADRRSVARVVVAVPRRDRRVHRDAAVPLHRGGHGDRVQAPDGPRRVGPRRGVRRRGRPRHRLVLRRHDLRARLLHRRHLRRAHQPGRHLRPVPSAQGLPGARGAVYGGAVPRRHVRRRPRQGLPERLLQQVRRRRQRTRRRLLHGHRPTAEIIGTFVLVYTVFSATDPKRNARDSHVPVSVVTPPSFSLSLSPF